MEALAGLIILIFKTISVMFLVCLIALIPTKNKSDIEYSKDVLKDLKKRKK